MNLDCSWHTSLIAILYCQGLSEIACLKWYLSKCWSIKLTLRPYCHSGCKESNPFCTSSLEPHWIDHLSFISNSVGLHCSSRSGKNFESFLKPLFRCKEWRFTSLWTNFHFSDKWILRFPIAFPRSSPRTESTLWENMRHAYFEYFSL